MNRYVSLVILVLSTTISVGDIFASTQTIHSIPGYGNWSDYNSWSEWRIPTSDDIVEINGIINLNMNSVVAGMSVRTGATLSGPYSSLVVNWDIENAGTWNVANTRIYGSGGIIDTSSPIGWNLIINTTVEIPKTFTLNGLLTFNDSYWIAQTIDIAPGQWININGGMSGIGNIVGVDTFINLLWGMTDLILTGSSTNLNILWNTPVLANSIILAFKNISLFPGATFAGNYPPSLQVTIRSDILTIYSWATLWYVPSMVVDSSIVNNGAVYAWNMAIFGNVENNWIWSAPTRIYWLPSLWATNYTIRFDPGTSTGLVTTGNSYYLGYEVLGSYYWQVEPDNAPKYTRHCINISGCTSSWWTPPVNTLPSPTNLTQQVQSPGLGREPIRLWEKIWKYQSGSGVILSASGNTTESARLVVDVYRSWSITPNEYSGGYTTNETKELTLPYLWAWDYHWKARIETQSWAMSDWVDFGTNNPEETDYILYEWFEPYPYGYSFVNSIPDSTLLTWKIKYERNFLWQVIWRTKLDWTKWDIMNKIFPESSLGGWESEYLDAFESLWLQNERPIIFSYWSCFWLSLSALTRYYYPELLQKNFPEFSKNIWTWFIWDNINILSDQNNKKWIWIDDNIKTILSYQLYQREESYVNKEIESSSNDTPISILNKIKNAPWKYLLNIAWKNCYIFWSICSDEEAHTVVPYKVEWNKIYIWDNNYPYAKSINEAYNRYIEIDIQNNKFTISWYWNTLTDMLAVSVYNAYTWSTSPIWFSKTDTVYSLLWSSDLQVVDSQWRVSWFSWWNLIEEIPWVYVLTPLGITPSSEAQENTWKQIYLPQKLPWLTIKVFGKTIEPYDLMIAWWDYYTKLEWVTTSTGQLDNYQVTGTGIAIDFDNQKTGNYSLLIDNFQSSLTGTIFLSDILSTPVPQKISYDWNKVSQNTSDAVLYQVDTNSDGIYDISSTYQAIPISLQATGNISWYIKWNTNASMAGWKVILTKQQDPTCKEDWKKWKDDDKQKNKYDQECQKYENDDDHDHNNRDDNKDREGKEHNREIFAITDKKWYYTFTSLSPWMYSVSIESQKNWTILKPQNNIYNITLSSWQNIINLNFETTFLKGKNK